jgi:hypothetical protein
VPIGPFAVPIEEKTVDLWPFAGSFEELLARGRTVFVETYPGDVYSYVGVEAKISKRVRRSRAASSEGIRAWADGAGVALTAPLVDELRLFSLCGGLRLQVRLGTGV